MQCAKAQLVKMRYTPKKAQRVFCLAQVCLFSINKLILNFYWFNRVTFLHVVLCVFLVQLRNTLFTALLSLAYIALYLFSKTRLISILKECLEQNFYLFFYVQGDYFILSTLKFFVTFCLLCRFS